MSIELVQNKAKQESSDTISVTLDDDVTPGNLLVAVAGFRNGTAATTYDIDNGDWTQIARRWTGATDGDWFCIISYCFADGDTGKTFTLDPSLTNNKYFAVFEYSGVVAYDTTDGVDETTGSATASLAPTASREVLLVSTCIVRSDTTPQAMTAAGDMTEVVQFDGRPPGAYNHQIVANSSGAYTVGSTGGGTARKGIAAASFLGLVPVTGTGASTWKWTMFEPGEHAAEGTVIAPASGSAASTWKWGHAASGSALNGTGGSSFGWTSGDPTFRERVLSKGPLGYWLLDEIAPSWEWTDEVSGAIARTDPDDVTQVAGPLAGGTNYASEFAGNAKVTVDSHTGLPLGYASRSFMIWLKIDDNDEDGTLVTYGKNVAEQLVNITVTAMGTLGSWNANDWKDIFSGDMRDNEWHMIVAVYNGLGWVGYKDGYEPNPYHEGQVLDTVDDIDLDIGWFTDVHALAHAAGWSRTVTAAEVRQLWAASRVGHAGLNQGTVAYTGAAASAWGWSHAADGEVGDTGASGTAASEWKWSHAADGSEDFFGEAASTWKWSHAAEGSEAIQGTAASAFTWATQAAAYEGFVGQAASTWKWSHAAEGSSLLGVSGTAASAWTWAPSGSAVFTQAGTGGSLWTWQTAASGAVGAIGPAASAWGWSQAASGSEAIAGEAASAWVWSQAGAGAAGGAGTAASSWGWGQAAAGILAMVGTAASTWSWGHAASGENVQPSATGTGASSWAWSTIGSGIELIAGEAASAWAWSQAAAGEEALSGAGGSAWGWSHDASGTLAVAGTAASAWGWRTAASGMEQIVGSSASAWGWAPGGSLVFTEIGTGGSLWSWQTEAFGAVGGVGQAASAWGWGHASSGVEDFAGDAASAWGWGQAAGGAAGAAGAGASVWGWGQAAVGIEAMLGDAASSWPWLAAAAGSAYGNEGHAASAWGWHTQAVRVSGAIGLVSQRGSDSTWVVIS